MTEVQARSSEATLEGVALLLSHGSGEVNLLRDAGSLTGKEYTALYTSHRGNPVFLRGVGTSPAEAYSSLLDEYDKSLEPEEPTDD